MAGEEQQQHKVHALAVALPVQGHMRPLMHLATKLAAQGMFVTVVNVASNHVESAEVHPNIRFECIPDRIPVPVAKLEIFASNHNRRLFRQAYEAMEGDVEALVTNGNWNPPLCCMIGDVYLNWFPSLVLKLRLRAITFSTTNASSLLIDSYIPRLLAGAYIPVADADEEELVTVPLPGLPSPLRRGDLPIYFSADNNDGKFSRRYVKAQALANADWLLVNTNEALEAEALDALRSVAHTNVLAIGPLGLPPPAAKVKQSRSSDSVWEESRDCLAWLDQRKPKSVLYVSFGSIATIGDKQFVELTHGLADSEQAFLWAIRPNLVEGDTAAAREKLDACVQKGQACIVPWAPQVEVLSHASTGGFLTHCGWNSLLEAICCGEAGVPLIGWPREVEQTLSCCLVSNVWKIGTGLPSSRSSRLVTREEIASSVKELISGEAGVQMREQVAKLRAAMLDAAVQGQQQLQEVVKALATQEESDVN